MKKHVICYIGKTGDSDEWQFGTFFRGVRVEGTEVIKKTPIVRFVDNPKPTVRPQFEVYVDGFRIGFARPHNQGQEWRAVRWRESYVGTFRTKDEAIVAITASYMNFRGSCSPQKAKIFEEHAIKLTREKEREALRKW